MIIALIGNGAIAQFVQENLERNGHHISALLLRPERVREMNNGAPSAPEAVSSVQELPHNVEIVIDCAGHTALHAYGADILRAGYDLMTVSIGALADDELMNDLVAAAGQGGTKLHLASGAIGALDCLRAAAAGSLKSVRYIARKPPRGWIGSPADAKLDLETLVGDAQTHFKGSARQAAKDYPKNANVAAAVALAGLGFDKTDVELIADPNITVNMHEILAEGDFGSFNFQISGHTLPGNPRTSALAAMSVVSAIEELSGVILM